MSVNIYALPVHLDTIPLIDFHEFEKTIPTDLYDISEFFTDNVKGVYKRGKGNDI